MSRSLPWPLCRRRPGAGVNVIAAVDAEAQVALAYRAVLHREADPDGMANYVRELRNGRDLAWLIGLLAATEEFRPLQARAEGRGFPLEQAPPMEVALDGDPALVQALWDRVARVWSGLGETDAHWSVLTEARFRAGALDDAALAAFQETGAGEVKRLLAWLRRAGIAPGLEWVCAEFGCGVGRVTRNLAPLFRRVIGFDVSPPHLRAAAAGLAADGCFNVELVQVHGPADLAALQGVDLFYSVISLQHSPPPVIMDVLRHAFAGLRPGGCAFFQVPTYAQGYAYPAAAGAEVMEMHFVPQGAVLAAAHHAGLRVAEVQPDWCTGRLGEWISNTFLLVKDP